MVNQLIKCFLFVSIIALPMVAAWADLLPPPAPLRRIGYEVLVEVATAVAGASMLLRWVAGKVWKHPSDVTTEEVAGLKERLQRILPTLRSKFDEKYKVNSVEWLAEDGKCSPSNSTDEETRSTYEEFSDYEKLRAELGIKEVIAELAAIDKRPSSELARLDSDLSKLRKQLENHPGAKWVKEYSRQGELPYMCIRRVDNAWRTLCNDLLFSILESDAELRKECDGIPIEFLCNAMFSSGHYHPRGAYEGYYQKDDSDGLSDFQIRADMESLSNPRYKEMYGWSGDDA